MTSNLKVSRSFYANVRNLAAAVDQQPLPYPLALRLVWKAGVFTGGCFKRIVERHSVYRKTCGRFTFEVAVTRPGEIAGACLYPKVSTGHPLTLGESVSILTALGDVAAWENRLLFAQVARGGFFAAALRRLGFREGGRNQGTHMLRLERAPRTRDDEFVGNLAKPPI